MEVVIVFNFELKNWWVVFVSFVPLLMPGNLFVLKFEGVAINNLDYSIADLIFLSEMNSSG